MKKVLLGLLALIVVFGLFAAAGYAGYRFGYAQSVQTAVNSDSVQPGLRPFDDFGPRGMPMHRFGPERDLGRGGFPLRFGFFALLMFLGRIVLVALIILFSYWLLTRSGWRLTRQSVKSNSSSRENE
jgi:uncharacterized membrane protein